MIGKKIATIISYLLSPVLIAFYALIIFIVFPPFDNDTIPITYISIAIFFLCIFPMIAILINHKKGTVDIWVSNKKQRTPFYIIAILGYFLSSIIFFLKQDTLLLLFSLSYFTVTLILTICNFFTKISTHSAGVAGPMTALIFIYGLIALPLYLIILPIIWARLNLQAHTKFQILLGTLLSIIVTAFVYILILPNPLSTLL